MDTQKMITAIFLIAVAVGAVGAVAFIVIDGTQGGDDSEKVDFSDCVVNSVKDTYTIGDYFERTTTNPDGTKSVQKYTVKDIRTVEGNKKHAVLEVDTDGTKKTETIMGSDLMHYLYLDHLYMKPNLMLTSEVVKLETVYGKIQCRVYSGVDAQDGLSKTYYVGPNAVCYLYETHSSLDPTKITSVALTDTSFFSERPGQLPADPNAPVTPADPSKKVKDEIVKGDFIEFSIPQNDDKVLIDRYTVTEIDEKTGKLTLTNKRGSVSNTVTMTKQDFRDMLIPVMGGSILDSSKSPTVLDTVWGKVSTNVYYVKVPMGDKTIHRNLFVDASGILFKVVETGEDIKDNDGNAVKWASSFTLTDTSMLEGYTKTTE